MVAYLHFHPGRLDKNLCAPALGSPPPIAQWLGPLVNQYAEEPASGFGLGSGSLLICLDQSLWIF